ncbi:MULTISPECIES: cytochrome c biogenesis protein CcsA [Persicobacter]|uniref:Cytochrome c assembly protein n=1 Tax=Persicobacter diffluens TaxID=981 RepID=A0AAN4VWK3_9BACT|nr:cytochrome c biogenesis protein CcsA [Persicobacter sp. CCB-QB2]GJM59615.1 cytochrome c assembly protein [Persicobacter diffluens]
MSWAIFPYIGMISGALWTTGTFGAFKKWDDKVVNVLFFLGILLFGGFIAAMWMHLDRPPMRTLGETRLWYSLFIPLIGLLGYRRWKYFWLLAYACGMSVMFISINVMNPEAMNKALMPALRSVWFVPHVIVYLFAYAILSASSVVAIQGLIQPKKSLSLLKMGDHLVYVGTAFLTLGLLFGALWAKEAWGHYWTWDPKETWAFITWLAYMIYIHYRHFHPKKESAALWTLAIAFIVLLICWFGINYLPSAASSVHTYTS